MAYPYSVFKTYTAGEILTASDLNSTDVRHPNQQIPEDTDDYSNNLTEMQLTEDPYPGAAASLPTTLAGEVTRLRYQLKAILGETHWYIDADTHLVNIAAVIGSGSSTQILAKDGNAGAPSISISSDPDNGMYLAGTNVLGFAAAGTGSFQVRSNGAMATDGTISNPGYSFISDPDTGIYRDGANSLTIVCNGANALNINATGINSYIGGNTKTQLDTNQLLLSASVNLKMGSGGQIQFDNGTVSVPGISFADDTDMGIYKVGSNIMGFAVSAASSFQIRSSGVMVKDGTVSNPGYAFISDTDTGIYRTGADTIDIACGGVRAAAFTDPADLGSGETSFFLYDKDGSALKAVTVGATDSGGSGYKLLRITN